MNCKQLLTSSDLLFKNAVLGIKADEYPLLFINRFLDFVQKKVLMRKIGIDLQDAEPSHVVAQLEMSFLGQAHLYWLGDLSDLSVKAYEHWLTYLISYKGPHKLVFFTKKDFKDDVVTLIDLPQKVDRGNYKSMILPLWPIKDHECILMTLDYVFKQVGALSLDQAIRLTDYALVLGAGRRVFVDSWIDALVQPESSLFNLSGALFAGDKKGFLEQWKRLKTEYEFPFWMAYFSEQFFRATYYVSYKKQNDLLQAKKIGFRLPFSFLQKDWKRWEMSLLQKAHQRVCDLDFQLKNGGSLATLESLFTLFLK